MLVLSESSRLNGVLWSREGWEDYNEEVVEQFLPIPEIRGSIPVVGNFFLSIIEYNLFWKDVNKEKRPGISH